MKQQSPNHQRSNQINPELSSPLSSASNSVSQIDTPIEQGWIWGSKQGATNKNSQTEDTPKNSKEATKSQSFISKITKNVLQQELQKKGMNHKILQYFISKKGWLKDFLHLDIFSNPQKLFHLFSNPQIPDETLIAFAKSQPEFFSQALQKLQSQGKISRPIQQGLRRVLDGLTLEEAKRAYAIRFGHELVDDLPSVSNDLKWTIKNITILWDQLDVLPESDVKRNTMIDVMIALQSGGGWASESTKTIAIGVEATPENIAETVRHEIGHAVHFNESGLIDNWLKNDIQFIEFGSDKQGYRSWLDELGGFPSAWMDASGKQQSLHDDIINRFIDQLQIYVGRSDWSPTANSFQELLEKDPLNKDILALWSNMPKNVTQAINNSTAYWYRDYKTWGSGPKGKYFLNFYYGRPFSMSARAEKAVDATSSYASMSHFEFFAECYTEFFADPNGFVNNSLWGGKLPNDVKTFFTNHVLHDQPYKPKKNANTTQGTQKQVAPPKPTGMPGTPS